MPFTKELGGHFNVGPLGASATDTVPIGAVNFFGKHDKVIRFKGVKVLVRAHLGEQAKLGLSLDVRKGKFVRLDENLSNVFLDPILERVPFTTLAINLEDIQWSVLVSEFLSNLLKSQPFLVGVINDLLVLIVVARFQPNLVVKHILGL